MGDRLYFHKNAIYRMSPLSFVACLLFALVVHCVAKQHFAVDVEGTVMQKGEKWESELRFVDSNPVFCCTPVFSQAEQKGLVSRLK